MRFLITLLHCFSWALLTLSLPAASAPAGGALAFEEGFAPTQDVTVWPLHIAHGYPLVRAQVGDVAGMLMIDTGTPWGLFLNSARVKLPDATPLLSGSTGSGQALAISRSSQMPALHIHGQTWAQVRGVHSADLSFIEQGTGMGPYLGFIGANFFKNAALTLDYARRVAVLQRLHPDTGAPLQPLPATHAGSTPVASVTYRGEQASFPVFDARLGTTPVRVMFDSGNPGVSIDAVWLTELQSTGAAQPFSSNNASPTYRLPALHLADFSIPLDDASAYTAAATVNGQTDRQLVKLGFSMLKRVGVTWNYQLRTMTFFTP